MIKSLSISNFQSHKLTHLSFDKGVNAIIGESDKGKSSIIRALLWAITNKPDGNAFRSTWGGETKSIIEIDNYTITRIKGKENIYLLKSNISKKQIEFKAFGTSVPEEIKSILNIDAINVQRQMDSHFLLKSSPGEVGRIINKAVKIDVIDKSIKNIASLLKEENNKLSLLQQNILEKKEILESYHWLNEAEIDISIAEDTEKEIMSLKLSSGDITDTLNSIDDNDLLLRNKSAVLTNNSTIKKLIALSEDVYSSESQQIPIDLRNSIDKINANDLFLKNKDIIHSHKRDISDLIKIDNEANVIDEQITQLAQTTENIIKIQEEIQKLNKNEKAIKEIEILFGIDKEAEEFDLRVESITNCLDEIELIEEKILKKKKNVNKMNQEFEDMMGDTCPLCGAEIK